MTIDPASGEREYRRFGLTVGGVLATVFGLAVPLLRWHKVWWWPLGLGMALMVWGLVHPRTLRWLYGPWMKLAGLLGRINATVLLTLFFYLVVTPWGLLLRLCGHDAVARRFDRQAATYRRAASPPKPGSMSRPY